MYVSVTRVNMKDVSPDVPTIVAEELEQWLADLDGFQGFLMLANEASSMALTFWESREIAERHRFARDQVRDRVTNIAGATIEEVVEYDVAFAHLGPLTVDPTT